jgi:hypothetical protein
MRFRDGAPTRRYRGVVYQVQRYFVGGREMLYLMTFCLPRFLDQPFAEKLVTVFHELYHIGPNFDGDLRRHGGRYAVHTRSQKEYDARMAALVRRYLAGHPDPAVFGFLRMNAAQLGKAYGGVTGTMVPRPKMVPVVGGHRPLLTCPPAGSAPSPAGARSPGASPRGTPAAAGRPDSPSRR